MRWSLQQIKALERREIAFGKILRNPKMKYHVHLSPRHLQWTVSAANPAFADRATFSKPEATRRVKRLNRDLFLFLAEQDRSVSDQSKAVLNSSTICGVTSAQYQADLKRDFRSPEVRAVLDTIKKTDRRSNRKAPRVTVSDAELNAQVRKHTHAGLE